MTPSRHRPGHVFLEPKLTHEKTTDLHAAPGSQNADSHSGVSSHKPQFLKPPNMEHTMRILSVLLTSLSSFPNVVGIELLNEPQPGDKGHGTLKDWYTNTIGELRCIDPAIPIYISDCWQTDDYAGYIASLTQSQSIIALDHHLYRCFTALDTHTSISQHSRSLTDTNAATPQLFASVSSKLSSCSSGIVVGEWSGAVHPGSLHGLSSEQETHARKEYIHAQLELYERYCAGWYFWTYKKEQPGDRGWSLRDAVGSNVFPQSVGMRARTRYSGDEGEAKHRRDSAMDKALGKSESSINMPC
jgi:aryl-phospho-beta-D-glucosidase BglC (GH1 family)